VLQTPGKGIRTFVRGNDDGEGGGHGSMVAQMCLADAAAAPSSSLGTGYGLLLSTNNNLI